MYTVKKIKQLSEWKIDCIQLIGMLTKKRKENKVAGIRNTSCVSASIPCTES